LTPAAVTTLAAQSVARESEAAFQSLLAATLDALPRLAGTVREAEGAALSLAQRETARTVAEEIDATRQALQGAVADEARCLASGAPTLSEALRGLLRPDRQRVADAARALRNAFRPAPEADQDWFAATAHAVEALGESAEHLGALAAAQPPASASRALGSTVSAALRRWREAMLADIARLVD
ncbi:MAG: hypothetical protein AAFQ43_05680, partial [Bacteroidota bacterium]